jgi:hypothetical protein
MLKDWIHISNRGERAFVGSMARFERPSSLAAGRAPACRPSVRARLPHGTRTHRVEATDSSLQVRPVTRLAEDQEPGQSGDGEGAGRDVVRLRRLQPSCVRSFMAIGPQQAAIQTLIAGALADYARTER